MKGLVYESATKFLLQGTFVCLCLYLFCKLVQREYYESHYRPPSAGGTRGTSHLNEQGCRVQMSIPRPSIDKREEPITGSNCVGMEQPGTGPAPLQCCFYGAWQRAFLDTSIPLLHGSHGSLRPRPKAGQLLFCFLFPQASLIFQRLRYTRRIALELAVLQIATINECLSM